MTLEELKRGSEFHTVKLIGTRGEFQIFATGKSEEHVQRFHEIVADAVASPLDGYEVEPHASNMAGKGRYDTAAFYIIE